MNEKRYVVYMDEKIVAKYMTISAAMILIKGLFETFPNIKISLVEEQATSCNCKCK